MEFKEIYRQYWPKVYRLALGFVNDPSWAKDISQDTFVTVLEKLGDFRNEAKVGTWIFRIASNQCLRQIEKSKRIPQVNKEIDVAETPTTDKEAQSQYLYDCIATLNEIDRLIISLELEDINQKEIANIVGISPSNVRVKVHRIKEKLTKKFENYEK